ncbi:MAG: ATP-binding cassette domain-containing protein [Pseudomonadota bacterium]
MTDMIEVDVTLTQGTFTLQTAFVAPFDGVLGIVGPSGSGKSTLFACLAGLRRPERGRIVMGGQVLFDSTAGIDLSPRDRGLGIVFQDGLLFPHLSVRRNLTYGMRRFDERLFRRVVAVLGLEPLLTRRPPRLSGGERQRVAIGRALLARPRMLLMDEPLAALDPARKEEVLQLLRALRAETGVPMLYISHAPEEIRRLADSVIALRAGRLGNIALAPANDVPEPRGVRQWA